MRTTARASGHSRIGCILWLIGLLIFGMIAYKAIPVLIQNAEFEDFLNDQARFAARASGEEIKKRILRRADELDVPLDPKRLTVRKGSRRIRIECSYEVSLEFPFYTYVWKFDHEVDRPIFII